MFESWEIPAGAPYCLQNMFGIIYHINDVKIHKFIMILTKRSYRSPIEVLNNMVIGKLFKHLFCLSCTNYILE